MRQRKLWIRSLVIGLLFLSCSLGYALPIKLTHLCVTTDPHSSHIVLNLSDATQYHVFTLSKPERVVVDLSTVKLATSLNIQLTHTPVLKVREANFGPHMLRLVFQLAQPFPTHNFKLCQTAENGKELIINLPAAQTNTHTDLQQTEQWTQENLAQIAAPTDDTVNTAANNTPTKKPHTLLVNAANISSPAPTETATTPNSSRRAIVVVIDPGHGGKDSGTIGPMGIDEKDVVLAVSRDLYQLLQKEPGYRPALTRSADYFIPLRGRLAIARQDHGDMFIAIHADSYRDADATGAAVFALSAHGASTEAARWLAEKENYSELGDVTLSDKSDLLRSVLIDLSQTATISSSMQLGGSILQQLGKIGHLHYTHVEAAPFMVLKSPDIPSLLVETGFLSNPSEERRLSDSEYQEKIAEAMCTGIKNYFANNPPPGTLVAAEQGNHHVS